MKNDQKAMAVYSSGMVTGVGLTAASTCAALRCALDGFSETRFSGSDGEWIVGSPVMLDQPKVGLPKFVQMAASAIDECLQGVGEIGAERIPLILCVAELERPGRLPGLDHRLFKDIQHSLGMTFHPLSDVIATGRVGGAQALLQARKMIFDAGVPFCIIAGVDSFLSGPTLLAYEQAGRLLNSENSNGFIPGEAAAAILVGPPSGEDLLILGIGESFEKGGIETENPLCGDGIVAAIKQAMDRSGCNWNDIDYRLADCNGEAYGFREASLAVLRLMRVPKELFEIWHPADCIGEIGAAIVPCLLGIALAAHRKGYAPGRGAIAHVGNDRGERIGLVVRSSLRHNG